MAALEARGLTCWMSSRDIPLGEDYQGHIVAALEAAAVVLVLLSRHSSASKEVPKETAIASEMNKTMIPVRIDASEVTGPLRYQATNAQRLNLSSHFDARIDELARQLARVLDTAESTERRLQSLASRRMVTAVLVWPVALAVLAALAFEVWHFAPRPPWLAQALGRVGARQGAAAPPPPRQTPAAAQAPVTPAPNGRVRDFVYRYYAALSGTPYGLSGFMEQSVSDPIELEGRSLPRRVLIAEEMAYFRRWPDRAFRVRPDTVQANCSAGQVCSASGVLDFTLKSQVRHVVFNSTERFNFRVSLTPSPRLLSISTSDLKRP